MPTQMMSNSWSPFKLQPPFLPSCLARQLTARAKRSGRRVKVAYISKTLVPVMMMSRCCQCLRDVMLHAGMQEATDVVSP